MRMNLLRVGLAGLIAAGVSSCGGEAGQPLTAASAQGVVAQLNVILGQLPRSNTAVNLPANLTNGGATTMVTKPGVNAMAVAACGTITPSPLVDADGDNIPAKKTETFDCTDFVSTDFRYTRQGNYVITDLDETKAGMLGGMRVDFNVDKFSYVNTDGDTGNGTSKGFWDYRGTSNGGITSTADYAGTSQYKSTRENYDGNYSYSYTWNYSLTPDNPASSWTTGSQEFKGDYTMSGKFVNESEGSKTAASGTFVMSYYSKNLKYDSTCGWFYRSGSVFMDDKNGNVLELRYLCTGAEFYVNGVKSDWYKPSNG